MLRLTREQHHRLERLVASKEPFGNRDNFARLVAAQYLFQRDLRPIYHREALTHLFPDLAARSRVEAARIDLAALGHAVPESKARRPTAGLPQAEELGWLFVSEGSKLGAAALFKRAAALGLDENSGARHLADPEGRRDRNWKTFVAVFDTIELNDEEERLTAKGAGDAFDHFGELIERSFA
ncbi:biliverdin-producing heme oxygenase [Nocardia brevicatena]|uniref:biliverdin-producing heme oxygenase n=1 Tax=Nocardia brevicatena TaxID=37327 RepID=UPI00247ADF9F|nr:biliverdin-producing heme oxygenase [Nocardia brevicatena]